MVANLILTRRPIEDPGLAALQTRSEDCGAVVTFLGVVRGKEAGEPIAALEYEAFPEMAQHQFKLLFQAVEKRWPVASLNVIHRLGIVPAGETSLWVQVRAAHRQEAFAACEWLINEMKKVVPIWKKPIPDKSGSTSAGTRM